MIGHPAEQNEYGSSDSGSSKEQKLRKMTGAIADPGNFLSMTVVLRDEVDEGDCEGYYDRKGFEKY